jgi:Pyridoxamine 5'-phosphate oxidase
VTREDAERLAEIQRTSYAAARRVQASWPARQALDADGLARLLDECRYAVLATGRSDGRPHAAPVAFVVHDGAFWIATVAGLRLRNLRAVPWASLVVMVGQGDEHERGPEPPHRAVTAEGPVTLHEGDAFAAAYGTLRREWRRRHSHDPDWAKAFLALRPERVFSYDASRGQAP